MMDVLKMAAEYGIIGLLAAALMLTLLFATVRLYRDREKMREAYDERLAEAQARAEELTDKHHVQMRELQQRYITKAETWMQHFYELTRGTKEVLDAMERRYGR